MEAKKSQGPQPASYEGVGGIVPVRLRRPEHRQFGDVSSSPKSQKDLMFRFESKGSKGLMSQSMWAGRRSSPYR